MKTGENYKSGDVILVNCQFTDSLEIKKRPAVVLYNEYDNLVLAGITSNVLMEGVSLSISDGAIKPSVIKLNYIFTVSSMIVDKKLFKLSLEKKKEVHKKLLLKINNLIQ